MKKFKLVGLGLIIFFCSFKTKTEFYVSPTGNDSNSGTKNQPFLSFRKATEAISQIIKHGVKNQEIHVYFRGGNYFFDKSVIIKGDEFSSGNNRVIFSAYQNEKPVFSPGKELTGWKKVQDDIPYLPEIARGKVWVSSITLNQSGTIPRCLYNEKGSLINAVSKGTYTAENESVSEETDDYRLSLDELSSFVFPKGLFRNYNNLKDIEIITRPHWGWAFNILPLKSIDLKKDIGYTSVPGTYKICKTLSYQTPNLWVLNAIDYLNEPGEWVINSVEDKIYYWPEEGEPTNVYYPLLKELIRVEGSEKSGHILKNIVFKGITFAHGDRDTWDANTIGLQHDWALYNRSDALLRFIDTEGCVVDNCTFTTTGGGGVRFDFYSQKNKVINCRFNNLGGTAILFAEYGPGLKDVNKQNEIINNEIHDCGQLYLCSPGIFIWQSGGNSISHNLIYNTPYNGIVISGPRPYFFNKVMMYRREQVGTVHYDEIGDEFNIHYDGEWESFEPYQNLWDKMFPYLFAANNIVEYNEIHGVVQKIDDGNAIYLSGTGYNNMVRKNYIHDNFTYHPHGQIRADDQAKDVTITENIIYNFSGEGIKIKHPNYVTNNYVVDWIPSEKDTGWKISMESYLGIAADGPLKGTIVNKNIFYQSKGITQPFIKLYRIDKYPLNAGALDSNLYYANNVYHNCLDQVMELRKQGFDINSIVADPCFEGFENKGFKLKSNSPASKLGIKQIDFENIGLLKGKVKLKKTF